MSITETVSAGAAKAAVDPEASRGRRRTERIEIQQHGGAGMFWLASWLFTIGFLHLSFWKGVLAIVAWPYYLGTSIATLLR